MTLGELVNRVRAYTRDTTGTLFSANDVKAFINEGIDRFRQVKQLNKMTSLSGDGDSPKLLPNEYHYALAMYSASRCFLQDEQHYASQTFMDEFNALFTLIELGIKEGTIIITDDDGNILVDVNDFDGVTDVYFKRSGKSWLE